MAAEENKALMRRALEEVWTHGRLEAIDELFSPDFVAHLPAAPEPIHGREAFREFVASFRGAFPDMRITVEDQVAEADKVATRWTATATHQGELMGIAPTGKQVTIAGTNINRIANGQIAEGWTNFDALGMLQQLGVAQAVGATA